MKKRPGDANHLNRLITEWVKKLDGQVTAKDARRIIGFSVLAAMFHTHGDTQPVFVLKGGSGLTLRFGLNARSTRDFDALTSIDLRSALKALEEYLRNGWEGFTGFYTNEGEIERANTVPKPMRCKVKLSYRGKPFSTIDFELGHLEDLNVRAVRVPNAVDLDPVLLESPYDVLILDSFFQVAQKLHACTFNHGEEDNPRVHDLYDICLLESLIRNDLQKAKNACVKTFEERQQHRWPPQLEEQKSWEALWENLDLPENSLSYAQATSRVKQLVEDIKKS